MVDAVRALYREPVLAGIRRGRRCRLNSRKPSRHVATIQRATIAPLTERINELAVAKLLIDDPTVTGPITYEPELPDGRRIDFVVDRRNDNLHRSQDGPPPDGRHGRFLG
jgi:hypothetical protein